MGVDLNPQAGNNAINNATTENFSAETAKTNAKKQVHLGFNSVILDNYAEINENISCAKYTKKLFNENTLLRPTYRLCDALDKLNDIINRNSNITRFFNKSGAHLTYPEFVTKCFEKLIKHNFIKTSKSNKTNFKSKTTRSQANILGQKTINMLKLSPEVLSLFCLLITQDSKSKLTDTIKQILSAKIKDRDAVSKKFLQETEKQVAEQIKSAKAQSRSKILGIFKAIGSAVAAIIGVAVTSTLTVLTAGGSTPLMIAACASCGLAFAGAICTCASSGFSIATAYTDSPKLKATLNKINMGLGIAGAVLGIAGAICSGGASIAKIFSSAPEIAMNISKSIVRTIKTIGKITQAATTAVQGGLQTTEGAFNINLAKISKRLAASKIELEQLDSEIAQLKSFIDMLSSTLQTFIQNMLECEEKAAAMLNEVFNTHLSFAANIV